MKNTTKSWKNNGPKVLQLTAKMIPINGEQKKKIKYDFTFFLFCLLHLRNLHPFLPLTQNLIVFLIRTKTEPKV